MNVVFLQGRLSSDPVIRELSSGSRLLSLEVTTSTDDGTANVPVAWFDPPTIPDWGAGVDESFGFRGFGNVSTDGDCLATGSSYGANDGIRAGFAGGVVDDDGGAFCGERFCDGGSDALGCAGDNCDFTFELAHIYILFLLR